MPDRKRPPAASPPPPSAAGHGAPGPPGRELHREPPPAVAEGVPPHAPHDAPHAPHDAPHHPAPPPPRGQRLGAADALYLSASILSGLWAAVLLFVVYPQSPVDGGYAPDDVPVMSLQGNVTTVKRAQLEEALASHQYLPASDDQVRYFEERRAATLRDIKRDKLFWYLAAACFPGAALLLFRLGWAAQRRGGGATRS